MAAFAYGQIGVVGHFDCGGLPEWNKRDLGRLLWMARDCWVEVLRCPSCGKTGEAQISAEDQLSWNFRVDAIPHGFKVIRIDAANVDYFFCASCDVPVEP